MKITRELQKDDKIVFTLEFNQFELILSNPTKSEEICRKLYDKTHKISDGLMYFSEVAKRLEDLK